MTLHRLASARAKRRSSGRGRANADMLAAAIAAFGAALMYFQWADAAAPFAHNRLADSGSALHTTRTDDRLSASFGLCFRGGGWNCVVDGDTVWFEGRKVRIADIDAPETHPPRCASEAEKGVAATRRLQALLNAGPFTLAQIDRDHDIYGRELRIISRGQRSLGDVLVSEGLARPYGHGRRPWCPGG